MQFGREGTRVSAPDDLGDLAIFESDFLAIGNAYDAGFAVHDPGHDVEFLPVVVFLGHQVVERGLGRGRLKALANVLDGVRDEHSMGAVAVDRLNDTGECHAGEVVL